MRFTDLILLEAQDYRTMFAGLIQHIRDIHEPLGVGSETPNASDEIEDDIHDRIRWARVHLRRHDRIIWYLRWYRLCAALQHGRDQQFYDMLRADYRKRFGIDPNPRLVMDFARDYGHWLLHYLSLPIPAIQNRVFGAEAPPTLATEFEAAEATWAESMKGMHPFVEEKVVLTFPDGMQWVHLPRGFCNIEGKAMGHCGNVSPQPGDTILSLRRIVTRGGRRHWESFLTFVLDKNGRIGESKGRANQKPAAKYHPYIVGLLRLPLIQGIKGGGYMPENNFKLAQLAPEQREALLADKPDLVPGGALGSAEAGFTADSETARQILSTLAAHDLLFEEFDEWVTDDNGSCTSLILTSHAEWQEIVEWFCDSKAREAVAFCKESEPTATATDDDVYDLLASIDDLHGIEEELSDELDTGDDEYAQALDQWQERQREWEDERDQQAEEAVDAARNAWIEEHGDDDDFDEDEVRDTFIDNYGDFDEDQPDRSDFGRDVGLQEIFEAMKGTHLWGTAVSTIEWMKGKHKQHLIEEAFCNALNTFNDEIDGQEISVEAHTEGEKTWTVRISVDRLLQIIATQALDEMKKNGWLGSLLNDNLPDDSDVEFDEREAAYYFKESAGLD